MEGLSQPSADDDGGHHPTCVALLRKGYEAGCERHGIESLSFDRFSADVIAAVRAARQALGLDTDEATLEAALRKRALADLVLARACEHGDERAWATLLRTYQARLHARVRRDGGLRAAPEEVVSTLFAELALPPAKANARTRIGTFSGMGALGAWLGIQVSRKVWRARERAQRSTALEAREPLPADDAPIWVSAVSAETSQALGDAVDSAWRTLRRTARLCVLFRHRHGMQQRRIGALLGLPAYQVTRELQRARSTLRAAVVGAVSTPGDHEAGAWTALHATLADRLATFEAREAPPPMQILREHDADGR